MNCFIGYSNKPDTRYRATSGGVGTALVNYLFDKERIETCLSFSFVNGYYEPELVHSFDDYKNVGSIYHEIDLVDFIRSNLSKIKGNILVFCLPCQVKAIRHVLRKNNIGSVLVALACSAQQTKGATDFLIKRSGLSPNKIEKLKYRGDGWPGGVTIEDAKGNKAFYPNDDSLWKKIFHSKIFILDQCFKCTDTISNVADISLADPWNIDIVGKEKVGNTLVFANNESASDLISDAVRDGYVVAHDIESDVAMNSQRHTMLRKDAYKRHAAAVRLLRGFIRGDFYVSLVTKLPLLFSLHCKLVNRFDRVLIKLQ